MQRGVAAAMQYLSSFAFVHRTLSARSVLVNSHLVCKVARLGHSPQVCVGLWRVSALHQVLGKAITQDGCYRWNITVPGGSRLGHAVRTGTSGLRAIEELKKPRWGIKEHRKVGDL